MWLNSERLTDWYFLIAGNLWDSYCGNKNYGIASKTNFNTVNSHLQVVKKNGLPRNTHEFLTLISIYLTIILDHRLYLEQRRDQHESYWYNYTSPCSKRLLDHIRTAFSLIIFHNSSILREQGIASLIAYIFFEILKIEKHIYILQLHSQLPCANMYSKEELLFWYCDAILVSIYSLLFSLLHRKIEKYM